MKTSHTETINKLNVGSVQLHHLRADTPSQVVKQPDGAWVTIGNLVTFHGDTAYFDLSDGVKQQIALTNLECFFEKVLIDIRFQLYGPTTND